MNVIGISLLVVCGILRGMEEKPSLTITPIAEQVLGFASKTGKIITAKQCPDASLGDVAVSPSGDFLAIMKGEWLSVACIGKEGSTAIDTPKRIKKFAGSLLFLDDTHFLVFREKSFYEYAIAQDEYGKRVLNRLSKKTYDKDKKALFCKVERRDPAVFSPTRCIVPLRIEKPYDTVLQIFEKILNKWEPGALYFHSIEDHFLGAAAVGAYALGCSERGDINIFSASDGILKEFSSACKDMHAIFLSHGGKKLLVGYAGDRNAELCEVTTKGIFRRAKVPLLGTNIQQVFWKDDGSKCLIVMCDGKSHLVSDMPVVFDTADND